jgi:aryl-alcohol dehydrogenase-like predicted oxidoreductase
VILPTATKRRRARSGSVNGYRSEVSNGTDYLRGRLIYAGVRDDVVIATKYTANVKDQQSDKYPVQINRSGNSYKSMIVSLEDSLKKLGTTYVDVFCESMTSLAHDEQISAELVDMHWWDWTTPIEEVMQGLNNLVKMGKGLSCRVCSRRLTDF